ncbi:MAG: class I SAM-dependent methyltransferase [Hyphomicrobiaceae bacterium]
MMDVALTSDASRMDRHYRYQRFIYDSTRTHYLLGRKHLLAELKPLAGQSVLEIGCGTAWNLVQAARRYPEARLFGVDISNAMLQTAQASLKRKKLDQRVVLRQGDATCFVPEATFGKRQFDRIFLSYALSMIPDWKVALVHATDMVAPGGSLHIVDFGQCGQLPQLFKSGLFVFLAHYTVTPRADLEECARGTAEQFGHALAFRRLHRGYTDYAVLRRAGRPADHVS